MAEDLCSLLEAVPLITIYIYTFFFGRSFVVRIKYVNRSSRELECVYYMCSYMERQLYTGDYASSCPVMAVLTRTDSLYLLT